MIDFCGDDGNEVSFRRHCFMSYLTYSQRNRDYLVILQ